MPVSALLSVASAAVRVASLNLCTDEYLLLAARNDQVASVSRLAADRDDSPLWRKAARLHRNDGQLESVIARRPTHLLTMGGSGRSTKELAQTLGIQVVDLPFPQKIDDVAANLAKVARLTGRRSEAQRWRARLSALRSRHLDRTPAAFIGQGGISVSPESLSAQWMRLGGFDQVEVTGGRLTSEDLTVRPPATLLKSSYRQGQVSRGQQWLGQRWVTQSAARIITTDGRPWTCSGPLMLYEIERLRGSR